LAVNRVLEAARPLRRHHERDVVVAEDTAAVDRLRSRQRFALGYFERDVEAAGVLRDVRSRRFTRTLVREVERHGHARRFGPRVVERSCKRWRFVEHRNGNREWFGGCSDRLRVEQRESDY